MNDQERDVIGNIFQRLEQAADQPRDPEAERFIADRIRAQPYAPYAMAQTIFVQEQALNNLNAQVEQLAAELEEAHRKANSGGFLSGLFGGGQRELERRPMGGGFGQPMESQGYQPGGYQPGGPQQGGPWGNQQPMQQQGGPWAQQQPMQQPGPMMAQARGGGFLGTAMMTVAGAAGGMMLGSALANAFGGHGDAAKGGLGALAGGADGKAADAGGSDHSQFSPFGNSPQSGDEHHAAFDAGDDSNGGGDSGGGDFT